MGWEAALMLDRMMRGGAPRKRPTVFAPINVVERQSTDLLAVADREVAAALQFIRMNVADGLGVDDVAREVGLSRRVLERRFRRLLQRDKASVSAWVIGHETIATDGSHDGSPLSLLHRFHRDRRDVGFGGASRRCIRSHRAGQAGFAGG
jgi:hypothetical protein